MLEDILVGQKSSFGAGVHTELRGQINRNRTVYLQGGNIVANQRAERTGVSARVCKNGVYGFSSMAEYSKDAASAVLRAATANAEFMDRHIAKNKGPLPPLLRGSFPLNKER